MLRQRGLRLAVAESCTGGLVGHLLTNIAGSSTYYLGSVTAYAYEAKVRLLGVRWETLEQHGAVSPETAIEMARGVRTALAGGHRHRRPRRWYARETGRPHLGWTLLALG